MNIYCFIIQIPIPETPTPEFSVQETTMWQRDEDSKFLRARNS